ncbi:DMT family transporter [Candidatus Woesearchaeota archaeon]|nr:DMT family transporter [Candidatus Woesearchaeota archaeon]
MEKRGVRLVLATALISGVSVFANAYGVKGIDSSVFTSAKNLLVALLLLSGILLFQGRAELVCLTRRQWFRLMAIGLVGGSVPFLLFFKGLSIVSAAEGSFVHKTLVVWVALLALAWTKERVDWKVVLPMGMLLLGNFLLLRLSGLTMSFGIGLVLAATILWSVEVLLSKRLLAELSGTVVAFGRMAFGALFILVFLLATGGIASAWALGRNEWAWILITGVFLLGYVMTFYCGLKRVRATTATGILALGSVVTTLLQAAFAGKEIAPLEWTGLILLVLGVGLFVRLGSGVRLAGLIGRPLKNEAASAASR